MGGEELLSPSLSTPTAQLFALWPQTNAAMNGPLAGCRVSLCASHLSLHRSADYSGQHREHVPEEGVVGVERAERRRRRNGRHGPERSAAPREGQAHQQVEACGHGGTSNSQQKLVQVKVVKGFRGLGVTSDGQGVVSEIDPNSQTASANELHVGDRICTIEFNEFPSGSTLQQVIELPEYKGKQSYTLGVEKGAGGGGGGFGASAGYSDYTVAAFDVGSPGAAPADFSQRRAPASRRPASTNRGAVAPAPCPPAAGRGGGRR